MGQQQLLLLVLGIVIVGIAAVAGIQAFSEGKDKATTDAAINDATRVIADLQAWFLKPEAFGGGGEKIGNFNKVTYKAIGLDPADDMTDGDDSVYETVNGCITVTGAATGATVEIKPRSGGTCGELIATAIVKSASVEDGIDWTYE